MFMLLRRSGSRIVAPLAIVGTLPCPRPNSFIFSSNSLASEITVGSRMRMPGRAERTFSISGVAFASGGVKVSSTTSFKPGFSNWWSRIGFTNDTEAAVLSITMPMVLGRCPDAFSASSSNAGSEPSACCTPVAEVWNTYLKPREVIRSEYENVTTGNCARSVTSVTANVNELRYAPVATTRFGDSATMRCAAYPTTAAAMKSRPLTRRYWASASRVGSTTMPRWLMLPACMSSRTRPWPITAFAKAASQQVVEPGAPMVVAPPALRFSASAICTACRLQGRSRDSKAQPIRSARHHFTLSITCDDRLAAETATMARAMRAASGSWASTIAGLFIERATGGMAISLCGLINVRIRTPGGAP